MSSRNRNSSLQLGLLTNKSKEFKYADHRNMVLRNLCTFYEKKEFLDIALIAGIDDVKLEAHRIVLSASSDYFLELFRNTPNEAKTNVVELKEIDGVIMKLILDYMYTGSIELRSETLEKVLRAADFLQMNNLVEGCCEFMGEQLNASNCLSISLFAEEHNYSALYEESSTFAYTHFDAVCKENEFFQLNEEQFGKLICSDNLCVKSEEDVFHSLVAWVEYDKENREKLIFDVLSHVRFPLLTPNFITKSCDLVCKTSECYELICSWLQWHISPETRSQYTSVDYKPRKSNEKLIFVSVLSTKDLKFQIYNEVLNSWTLLELPPPLSIRNFFGTTVINKNLIIAGGRVDNILTNVVEYLDLETIQWKELPPMLVALDCPGLAVLNGDLYVVGGHDGNNWSSSLQKYNFSKSQWQEMAPLISPCMCIKVAVLGNLLYAVGDGCSTIQCYDPIMNEWKEKALKNEKLKSFGFAAVGEHLYVVGGFDDRSISGTVERYHPSNNTWTVISSLGLRRTDISCVSLDNRLVLCGGFDGFAWVDLVEEYNPVVDKWTTLPSLLPYSPRYNGDIALVI